MKRFQFKGEVFVYHREAAYRGEYRGRDSFERQKHHTVYIPKMGIEVDKSDQEVFRSLSELKKTWPNAYNLV